MKTKIKTAKKCLQVLPLLFLVFGSTISFAQKAASWQLEKMPVALETDFALSALPPQLRPGATIYLLDPNKGYYIARKGSNGFVCYVNRTGWEWADFRTDVAAAIGFDAAGASTIFRVDQDVAAMRASGKFTAVQIRDLVVDRIKKGIYKAPARAGISYMLGPVMRTYTGTPVSKEVMTMNMPHYMFYAPYITNTDIGNIPNGQADGPVVINAGDLLLGTGKGPFGYMILGAGETEKAKIIASNTDVLKRLIAYKPYFKAAAGMH